jgi:dihydrofolate reductase
MEAIFATDIMGGLSKNGQIPWNSKKDMQFFYQTTVNHVVIMGSNTFFSLSKPLKNRLNIVLSREKRQIPCDFGATCNNVIFTNNANIHTDIYANRAKYCEQYAFLSSDFKIYIIGGAQIYRQFIPLCERIWATRIKKDYDCDLFYSFHEAQCFPMQNIVYEDDVLCIMKYSRP